MLFSISTFQYLDFSHTEYIEAVRGVIFWGISFYFEALVVIAFSFFAALILKSAVFAVMSTFAFYFISRLIGFFLISITNPVSTMRSTALGYYSEKVLHSIGMLLPRLDMFSKSEWLIYGMDDLGQYTMFLVSSVVYIALILTMALYDFVRKQF